MKHLKLFHPLIMALCLVLLAACAAAPTETTSETVSPPDLPTEATEAAPAAPEATTAPTEAPAPTEQTPAEMAESAAFPVTITDDLGREVTIEAAPDRLISLSPGNTESLFAIGAGPQVVGVTEYDNYPPETSDLAKVGGFSSDTISMETIVSLQPDLVLTAGEIHRPIIDALEEIGVAVVAVTPLESLEAVYESLQLLGAITGHAEGAATVVEEMQARVAAVTEKTQALPEEERPTVYYEIWNEPLLTAGPDTFAGELIELAGGRNIFGELEEQYPQVSVEEIVQRDPEVILGPDSQAEALTVEVISARPGWADLQAIQNERIYLVDGDIVSRPGPRLVDALELFASALHPDLFPQ